MGDPERYFGYVRPAPRGLDPNVRFEHEIRDAWYANGTPWSETPTAECNIETMYRWVAQMSDTRTYTLAAAWGRAAQAFAETSERLRATAAALAAHWRSPAGQEFLRQVGATLMSLDEWQSVASENAAGLREIAAAIGSGQRRLRTLYEAYVHASAWIGHETVDVIQAFVPSHDAERNDAGLRAAAVRQAQELVHSDALESTREIAQSYTQVRFRDFRPGIPFEGPAGYAGGPAPGDIGPAPATSGGSGPGGLTAVYVPPSAAATPAPGAPWPTGLGGPPGPSGPDGVLEGGFAPAGPAPSAPSPGPAAGPVGSAGMAPPPTMPGPSGGRPSAAPSVLSPRPTMPGGPPAGSAAPARPVGPALPGATVAPGVPPASTTPAGRPGAGTGPVGRPGAVLLPGATLGAAPGGVSATGGQAGPRGAGPARPAAPAHLPGATAAGPRDGRSPPTGPSAPPARPPSGHGSPALPGSTAARTTPPSGTPAPTLGGARTTGGRRRSDRKEQQRRPEDGPATDDSLWTVDPTDRGRRPE